MASDAVHTMVLNSTVTIEDRCDANYRTHLILTYCFVSMVIFNHFQSFLSFSSRPVSLLFFFYYSIEPQFKSNMRFSLVNYQPFVSFFLSVISVAIVSFSHFYRSVPTIFAHVCVRSNKAIPF